MIDPKTEAPLREMLGHALHGELDDLYRLIDGAGSEKFEAEINLAVLASGYISVHVSGRWPTAADVREIASHAADTQIGKQLTVDEFTAYLSRVVLRGESPMTVFEGKEKAPLIPLFATAALLSGYGVQGQSWADYLDQIWNSLDAAEAAPAAVAPATVYLYSKMK